MGSTIDPASRRPTHWSRFNGLRARIASGASVSFVLGVAWMTRNSKAASEKAYSRETLPTGAPPVPTGLPSDVGMHLTRPA